MKDNNVFCFWSGGVTSHLSFYYAKKFNKISCLVTGLQESNQDSYAYQDISPAVLRYQARRLNIPLVVFNSTHKYYPKDFSNVLRSLKKHHINSGIFGYVSHKTLKKTATDICQSEHMESHFPLWGHSKEKILNEFLSLGFRAKIIAVHEKTLIRNLLGRDLDQELIEELKYRKIDICAENGEYHTLVYEGPIYKEKLKLKIGEPQTRNEYWTMDLCVT